jgi:hypothetical protein
VRVEKLGHGLQPGRGETEGLGPRLDGDITEDGNQGDGRHIGEVQRNHGASIPYIKVAPRFFDAGAAVSAPS